MKVAQAAEKLKLKVLSMPCPDREISGGYVGDLLSWVMGRVSEGNAWIMIMSNINIVAVASLADVACVILAESVTLDQSIIDTANAKNINILSTDLSAFDISLAVADLIK